MLFHLRKIQTNSNASQTFCGSAIFCKVFKWPSSIFYKSHLMAWIKCKTVSEKENRKGKKRKREKEKTPLYTGPKCTVAFLFSFCDSFLFSLFHSVLHFFLVSNEFCKIWNLATYLHCNIWLCHKKFGRHMNLFEFCINGKAFKNANLALL